MSFVLGCLCTLVLPDAYHLPFLIVFPMIAVMALAIMDSVTHSKRWQWMMTTSTRYETKVGGQKSAH